MSHILRKLFNNHVPLININLIYFTSIKALQSLFINVLSRSDRDNLLLRSASQHFQLMEEGCQLLVLLLKKKQINKTKL